MKNQRKVLLWDCEGLLAIIIENSGVVYSNQTCGTSCMQSEEEGFLIPFNNDFPIDSPNEHIEYKLSQLMKNKQYLTSELADKIDEVFIQCGFQQVSVDRTKLKKSHEAWIYVEISDDVDFINGFEKCNAVLTWQNSD